ncbi:MAG: recombinase family protein [Peptococcaceae bacterium]|nr:recombinase family protein [Peptococcaceae bacterium]
MEVKYAVAYARFSSDNQREESIDAQIRAIRKYCEQNDYLLLNTYIDEARSATTDDRPAFQQMMSDAEDADWGTIIVHKLDRFSRNRYDSAIYKKKLQECHVQLVSVLEHLDGSPESVILESLLDGMAEYYSANLSREVKKGKRETALQCKHNGGQPPFGYIVKNDGTYDINEYEAAAVRLIFNRVAEGHSFQEIRRELQSKGYHTRAGKDFSPSTLNAMLHNEKYNGTYVYNRTVPQPKNGKRSNDSRPDDEILRIPDGIPAIVDMELFTDVQLTLKRRATQSAKRSGGAKEVYLLQGLIKCGNCGSAMTGTRLRSGRSKTLNSYYECIGRKKKRTDCRMRMINRDLVENIVIDYIEQMIFSDDAMENVRAKLAETISDMQKETPTSLTRLRKEYDGTLAELDRLIDAIAAGLDPLRVKDKIHDLEVKRANIQEQIDHHETREKISDAYNLGGLEDYIAKFRDIRSHSRKHQKEIINRFVQEVIIHDDPENPENQKITLHLTIPKTAYAINLHEYRSPQFSSRHVSAKGENRLLIAVFAFLCCTNSPLSGIHKLPHVSKKNKPFNDMLRSILHRRALFFHRPRRHRQPVAMNKSGATLPPCRSLSLAV